MKKIIVFFILAAGCFAIELHPNLDEIVGVDPPGSPKPSQTRSVLVSPVGDIRAILGPQGKNIVVNEDGSAVAVIYGNATTDPDNPMEVCIAYSTDGGTSFTRYGPFSPELRRIYPGVDAIPDFATEPCHIFFSWHESPYGFNIDDLKTMLDENVPSSPLFTRPLSLPSADTLFPWMTCISVAPDNPMHLIASGWNYLNAGNGDLLVWSSDDGGFTWTGPIVLDNLPADGGAGVHVRQGTGGYVAATYQNLYNWGGVELQYPYLIESTNGGITWLPRIALPVPYVDTQNSQFWWTDLELEVINNKPWMVHTDLGLDSMWLFNPPGGGPGSWTWNVDNIRQIGACSSWVADTLYLCYPGSYPSIAYDPHSGTILVTYKAFYYHGDGISWSDMNGPHVGGVYTMNDGFTWSVTCPLSTLNNGDIDWVDWNATETAHRFFCDGIYPANWRVYSVWVHETELNCYFEKGYPYGIEENSNIEQMIPRFEITPSVMSNICFAIFNTVQGERVSLKIYDALGRNTGTIFSGTCNKGIQKIPINISHLPNGTYFIMLTTGTSRHGAKITVVR